MARLYSSPAQLVPDIYDYDGYILGVSGDGFRRFEPNGDGLGLVHAATTPGGFAYSKEYNKIAYAVSAESIVIADPDFTNGTGYGIPFGSGGIGDIIWVPEHDSFFMTKNTGTNGGVFRFDMGTGVVTTVIDTSTLPFLKRAWGLCYDSVNDELLVTAHGEFTTRTAEIYAIVPDTSAHRTVFSLFRNLSNFPHGMTIDVPGRRAWFAWRAGANTSSEGIWEIDLDGVGVVEHVLGVPMWSLGYRTDLDRLFVGCQSSPYIRNWIPGAATLSEATMFDPAPTGTVMCIGFIPKP